MQRSRYKEGLDLEEIMMEMEQLMLYACYLELQRNRVIATLTGIGAVSREAVAFNTAAMARRAFLPVCVISFYFCLQVPSD